MEGNKEEDYLDSLLDSVSTIKDDVVEDELFEEDNNELINMLNGIMAEVDEEPEEDKTDSGILEDWPNQTEDAAESSDLFLDDDMKDLLGEHAEDDFQPKGLSEEEVRRLSQMDEEHEEDTPDLSVNEASEQEDIENPLQTDILLDAMTGLDEEPDETSDKNESKENKEKEKKGFSGFFKSLFAPKKKNNAKQDEEKQDDGKDENERLLNEVFDENGELIEENQQKGKKSFFSSIFQKKNDSDSKKEKAAKAAEPDEDEIEELEEQQRREQREKKRQERKEKKKEKKLKKEKKPKKPPKPAKPKKPKKEKVPPKPSELVKFSSVGVVIMVIIIAFISVFAYVGINRYSYNNGIAQAEENLILHNYNKAYDSIKGIHPLTEEDKLLSRQITVIMYVQKQYNSYGNYKKLGMEYEALDALIKGVGKYYDFLDEGRELGVDGDLTAVKDMIVTVLEEHYGISENLAETYARIEDVIQYYYIISSYGG